MTPDQYRLADIALRGLEKAATALMADPPGLVIARDFALTASGALATACILTDEHGLTPEQYLFRVSDFRAHNDTEDAANV